MHSYIEILLIESKLFIRSRAASFFAFIFPVILFLVFGSIFRDMPVWNRPDLAYVDFFAPALIGAYIGQGGLVNLASFIAFYRQEGILKRYNVSPLPLAKYLIGLATVHFGSLLVSSFILIVTGRLIFGLQFLGNVFLVASIGVLGVCCLFSLGFLISGLFSSSQTVLSVGQFLFLSMFFLSGAAVPRELFPEWLYTISSFLPLTHMVEIFSGLWVGEPLFQHKISLLILIGLSLVAFPLAIRSFSWEEK
ncbi:MAG: ABC transporter permease [Bacteroidetes bacterium]|nr:ABC transporter permease [Bacteroidota bacterium]MCY4204322.1 ABC transporter permease [Bacteroidota bacterium]